MLHLFFGEEMLCNIGDVKVKCISGKLTRK